MTLFKSSLLVVSLLLGAAVHATSGPSKDAPAEMAHFAKLIGQWSTSAERLKPDGSGWVASNSADWNFEWAYDGFGILDYYVSPPAAEKVDNEAMRQRGINLRTYNVKDNQWVMTWLTAAAAPPTRFTASSTDERIVMLGDEPNANGFYSRITFFDIKDDSFEWKLEWSKDQKQWREVSRIHGVRKGS